MCVKRQRREFLCLHCKLIEFVPLMLVLHGTILAALHILGLIRELKAFKFEHAGSLFLGHTVQYK